MSNLQIALILLGGFISSFLLTTFSVHYFSKIGLLDVPDLERKKHKDPVPLGGGFPIIVSFFLTLFTVEYFTGWFTSGLIEIRHLIAVFAASLVILVLGILDDKFRFPAKVAIIAPVFAVIIVHLGGVNIAQVTGFTGPVGIGELVSFLLISAWLMVMMFAVKFSDGVDGLAVSNGLVASLVLAGLTLSNAYYQPDMALMAGILFCVLLGFFVFNKPAARIYLGEAGSVWLGFILGVFAIIGGSKLLTVLIVMAVPALDAVFVVLRRLRAGASITVGDRRHLHHLLADSGWSKVSILAFYSAFGLIVGLTSLIFSSHVKYLILIIIVILFLFQFIYGRK